MRDMRDHLLQCPSLSAAEIDSIKARIQAEVDNPRRVIRDPRWTKEEERTLIRLDGELDTGKLKQRYKKMSATIGRSPQACRQKLLHLKENGSAKKGPASGLARKTRSKKVESDTDSESGEDAVHDKIEEENRGDLPSVKEVRHVTRQVHGLRKLRVGSTPAINTVETQDDSDATISDLDLPARIRSSKAALAQPVLSEASEQYITTVRSAIHHALEDSGVVSGYWGSGMSIEEGWDAFVASGIPHEEKNAIVAPLIGAWLDGLDEPAFELEVEAIMDNVVQAMSEWDFQFAEGTGDSDSGYEADEGDESDL